LLAGELHAWQLLLGASLMPCYLGGFGLSLLIRPRVGAATCTRRARHRRAHRHRGHLARRVVAMALSRTRIATVIATGTTIQPTTSRTAA